MMAARTPVAVNENSKITITGTCTHISPFECPTCPLFHKQKECPKAKKVTDFKINFFELPDVLQKRFVEVASVYEKSKLQKVCKSINRLIPPENIHVSRDLVAHANEMYPEEHTFWQGRGSVIHVHPEFESHLNHVHDLIINGKFNGVNLPNNWISKVLNQKVFFYLKQLHLEGCEVTENEFRSLCDYGGLEHIFLENITITPPPKIYHLAMFLTNAKKVHINIKNFKCDPNWPKYFTQFSDKRTIKKFILKNASMNFSPIDFDKFLRTRMVDHEDSEVRIFFDEAELKNMKNRILCKKLDRLFNGVFKRVIKAHYENFAAMDRFIIDRRPQGKSRDLYFFVNCRAMDTMMTKVKLEKLSIEDKLFKDLFA